jgi:hypothetical protein
MRLNEYEIDLLKKLRRDEILSKNGFDPALRPAMIRLMDEGFADEAKRITETGRAFLRQMLLEETVVATALGVETMLAAMGNLPVTNKHDLDVAHRALKRLRYELKD